MRRQQKAKLTRVPSILVISVIGMFAAVQLIAPEARLFGSKASITETEDSRTPRYASCYVEETDWDYTCTGLGTDAGAEREEIK